MEIFIKTCKANNSPIVPGPLCRQSNLHANTFIEFHNNTKFIECFVEVSYPTAVMFYQPFFMRPITTVMIFIKHIILKNIAKNAFYILNYGKKIEQLLNSARVEICVLLSV